MVIPDPFRPSSSTRSGATSNPEAQWQSCLASPLDRLAATVADFAILAPVISVILSMFRKNIILAKLAGHDEGLWFQIVGSFLCCVSLIVAYQTLCHYKWGATLGKKFYSLKVVNVWTGENTTLASVFVLRSLMWIAQMTAGLGFPFLSIFSNERRRPFHDRLSDTVVITLRRERAAGVPQFSEASPALSMSAMFVAILGLIFSIAYQDFRERVSNAEFVAADLESRALLCSQVGEFRDSLGADAPSRLEAAMGLYETDQIDSQCLKQEAQFAIWRDEKRDLANYAFALVFSGEDQLSGQYIERTCAIDANAIPCLVLRLKFVGDEPTAQSMAQLTADTLAQTKNIPWYARAVLVKYFHEQKNEAKVLELTESAGLPPVIASYFLGERVTALWRMGRAEEAQSLAHTTLDLLSEGRKFQMRTWACESVLADSCSTAQGSLCESFTKSMEDSELLFTQSDLVVTYVRAKECSEEGIVGIPLERFPTDAGKSLVRALELAAGRDLKAAKLEVQNLFNTVDRKSPYADEALARLVSWADSLAELKKLAAEWKTSLNLKVGSGGVERVAHVLMERMMELKGFDLAVDIGLQTRAAGYSSRVLTERLLIAAYRGGQTKLARDLARDLDSKSTLTASAFRLPASTPREVDRVLVQLQGRRDKP